jgi:hypothetical protein
VPNSTIGLATKTDEYVPIDTNHQREESPFSTGAPNRNRAITVMNVKPGVRMVLLKFD